MLCCVAYVVCCDVVCVMCVRERKRGRFISVSIQKRPKKKQERIKKGKKERKKYKRTVNSVNNDWQCCDKIKCLTHPNIKE